MAYASIPPDDYERVLVPMFGATVAFEVAAQVRCIIGRGDGTVAMTGTAAPFFVNPTPLDVRIRRDDWEIWSVGRSSGLRQRSRFPAGHLLRTSVTPAGHAAHGDHGSS